MTNLLKGSLIPAGTALIWVLLTFSCGSPAPDAGFPLVGHWKITGIETAESSRLDSFSRKIYQQEVNKMTDSAFVVFTADSTYRLRMTGGTETGRWKWDTTDSLLMLRQNNGKKSYYFIRPNGRQTYRLRKDLDPQKLVLVIQRLPS